MRSAIETVRVCERRDAYRRSVVYSRLRPAARVPADSHSPYGSLQADLEELPQRV